MTSLFIFHRDLRIYDNVGFINSIKYSIKNNQSLIPIFIFTPQQINKKNNKYFSNNSVQFMIESLEVLNSDVNNSLHYFYGETLDIINSINSKKK